MLEFLFFFTRVCRPKTNVYTTYRQLIVIVVVVAVVVVVVVVVFVVPVGKAQNR